MTSTSGGSVNTSSAIYSDRIMQAAANNNTTAGVSSSSNSLDPFGGAGANVGTSTSVGSSSGSTLQAERNGP